MNQQKTKAADRFVHLDNDFIDAFELNENLHMSEFLLADSNSET